MTDPQPVCGAASDQRMASARLLDDDEVEAMVAEKQEQDEAEDDER